MYNVPTLKELLEAGVHFGHQTKRWNPKMAQYIFTEKNGIHIIDLAQTLTQITEAVAFLEKQVSTGGEILFVGTKRQAQEAVEQAAKKAGVYYVTNRWVGGLLTNFSVTKRNVNKMLEIEEGMEKGFENRTKQEVSLLGKELERLQRLYGGIRGLSKKPAVIILADPHHERIVVKEAKKLGIPLVAIVDTNCDPDEIDYMIAGNDDAIGAITLFFNLFADVISDAKKNVKSADVKETKAIDTEKKIDEKSQSVKKSPKAVKRTAKKKEIK